MKKTLLLWLFVYLYSFLIFYYSGNPEPGKGIGAQHFISTYAFYIHLIEYIILTGLVYFAFIHTKHFQKKVIIPTILFVTLFAISDEFHQLFVPGRYFSILDITIDAFSSLLFFSLKTIYK